MLSEKSLGILMSCASCYLQEVVESHPGLIALTGGNPRGAKREIEAALDDANATMDALRAHRAKQEADKAQKKTDPPAVPATNREKIAAAIEEHAAAGVPNA